MQKVVTLSYDLTFLFMNIFSPTYRSEHWLRLSSQPNNIHVQKNFFKLIVNCSVYICSLCSILHVIFLCVYISIPSGALIMKLWTLYPFTLLAKVSKSLIRRFLNRSSLCPTASESHCALFLSHLCWSLLSLSSTANSKISGEETRWSFVKFILWTTKARQTVWQYKIFWAVY